MAFIEFDSAASSKKAVGRSGMLVRSCQQSYFGGPAICFLWLIRSFFLGGETCMNERKGEGYVLTNH